MRNFVYVYLETYVPHLSKTYKQSLWSGIIKSTPIFQFAQQEILFTGAG
jgi:hypothetical protein